MSEIKIYGIKNCDTMKKAMKWLEERDIDFTFHDYKKEGADKDVLEHDFDQCGWDVAINRRGTTWRKLPADVQNSMDAASAMQIALDNPSIIKRPLLVHSGQIHFGFKDDMYAQIFG